MIDLQDYFNPVCIESPEYSCLSGAAAFPHSITIHTENNPVKEIGKYKIAIVGVPEGRNAPNDGSSKGPDSVREQLYKLARIPGKIPIADLGNMKQGISIADTIAGLADVIVLLMSENVFPVIIGGNSSVIPAIDKAFASQNHKYTLASIDSRIDYCHEKKEHDSFNYLNAIINNSKSFLAHYINVGCKVNEKGCVFVFFNENFCFCN